jgi:glycerol uptake facilitator-like aquaporin
MFGLITLITQIKPFYGFDFWISSILVFAIVLSVKQSGAHYNPSMTLSNFLIKFSPEKINLTFIWTYFKADFFPAFLAFNMGFYMRGYFYPPPIPISNWDSYSIIIS